MCNQVGRDLLTVQEVFDTKSNGIIYCEPEIQNQRALSRETENLHLIWSGQFGDSVALIRKAKKKRQGALLRGDCSGSSPRTVSETHK